MNTLNLSPTEIWRYIKLSGKKLDSNNSHSWRQPVIITLEPRGN